MLSAGWVAAWCFFQLLLFTAGNKPVQILPTDAVQTVQAAQLSLEASLTQIQLIKDDLRWNELVFMKEVGGFAKDARQIHSLPKTGAAHALSSSRLVTRFEAAAQERPLDVLAVVSAGADLRFSLTALKTAASLEDDENAAHNMAAFSRRQNASLVATIVAINAAAVLAFLAWWCYRLRQHSNVRMKLVLQIADGSKADAAAAVKSKNEFLATVSHELRSPLQTLLASVEQLETKAGDPAAVLRRMRRGADALDSQLRDVMALANAENSSLEIGAMPFSITAVASKVCDVHREAALAKGIRLSLNLPFEPFVVKGDPIRVSQIIENLVSNAVRLTTQGSVVVTITKDDAVTGGFRFVVADTGRGISAADLPKLFKPFTRLSDSADEGRRRGGLGLAIVHSLAKGMGGKVSVKSVVGQGTTFTVVLLLPVVQLRKLCKLEELSVLVVEDDADIRAGILELFTEAGVTASGAGDADSALNALQPDTTLVLTDIDLPGTSGVMLAETIRATTPSDVTPLIVAMSAGANLSSLPGEVFAGALRKPISKGTIGRLVRYLTYERA